MIKIEGLQEKGLYQEALPFNVILNNSDNFTYPSHWHNALELIYAQENGMKLVVNGKTYTLEEKDVMIVASGDVHSVESHMEGRKLYLQIDPGILQNILGFEDIRPLVSYSRCYSLCDEGVNRVLEEHINNLTEAFFRKAPCHPMFILARICDILVLLYQHFRQTLDKHIEGDNIKKLHGLKKLNKAFEYIEENYKAEIKLKDAAKASGFSEAHFSRIFKEIYGRNFHGFLNEYRIKKAEKLLLDSDMTICDIALSSGYNSIVTFNRVFKELKGCTPREYIRMRE